MTDTYMYIYMYLAYHGYMHSTSGSQNLPVLLK